MMSYYDIDTSVLEPQVETYQDKSEKYYKYHRQFTRCDSNYSVRCAIMPKMTIQPKRFNRLRWYQTESSNFSSGGILLTLPEKMKVGSYLFLNIETDIDIFPKITIGQVRYCIQKGPFEFDAGLKFIVNENKDNHFRSLTINRLPEDFFEYDNQKQNTIENKIKDELHTRS